jgi:hypothetical protein
MGCCGAKYSKLANLDVVRLCHALKSRKMMFLLAL